MVTISSDGTTVTTSSDFNALVTQYSQATGPNTPSMSAAGTTTFPTCPSENSTFIASTTLPDTPSDTACACVVKSLSCLFTPATNNYTIIVGELLDEACGLLAQNGGTCDDIAGNGTTGVYGRLEYCDPASKLSYAMTQFYEQTSRNAASCSFAGNATINSSAPSSDSALDSAVSQCLAAAPATFTPTTPASPTGGSSGGGSGSHGSSQSASSATSSVLFDFKAGFAGVALMALSIVLGGALTLA